MVVALALVSTDALVTQKTGTALYAVERETGMMRQCFYNFLGSVYTATVAFAGLFPLRNEVVIR